MFPAASMHAHTIGKFRRPHIAFTGKSLDPVSCGSRMPDAVAPPWTSSPWSAAKNSKCRATPYPALTVAMTGGATVVVPSTIVARTFGRPLKRRVTQNDQTFQERLRIAIAMAAIAVAVVAVRAIKVAR